MKRSKKDKAVEKAAEKPAESAAKPTPAEEEAFPAFPLAETKKDRATAPTTSATDVPEAEAARMQKREQSKKNYGVAVKNAITIHDANYVAKQGR
jgi:hypothetical protein